jgi:hypothetical protein
LKDNLDLSNPPADCCFKLSLPWLNSNPRERLQAPAFEIAVNVCRRSNHEGKTSDEGHRRLGVPVYKSCHVVELDLEKKQHVAAGDEKRDAASWEFPALFRSA